MPKNKNKIKKSGKNLDFPTDSLIEKYQSTSIKFKICIYLFIYFFQNSTQTTKFKSNQTLLTGHHLFLLKKKKKKIKVFQ